MHRRRGAKVKGHYRNGVWIKPHFRSGSEVHDSHLDGVWFESNIRVQNNCYKSPCFMCNELVYYFRDENRGFAMFDELGSPWPIHSCWAELRNVEIITIEQAFKKALNHLPATANSIDGMQVNELKSITQNTEIPDSPSVLKKPVEKKWVTWQIFIVYLIVKAIIITLINTN